MKRKKKVEKRNVSFYFNKSNDEDLYVTKIRKVIRIVWMAPEEKGHVSSTGQETLLSPFLTQIIETL